MEQINSNNKNCLARVLLVTANVGTIFENLDVLFEPWMNEFTKKLTKLKPEFIALHMQEIGGKNYKTSMQSIDPFFKKFLSNSCIQHYNRYLIAIDSDFTDENNFTSLCNVYLIHESLKQDDVQLYNFSDKMYFNYTSRQIFSGNLNNNHLIYKERYKKHFFKDFQWSRKGFIQTKWRLKKHDFDFVNIHLFHDPSNLVALNSTPSIYSESRKKALEYSIKKIKENHLNSNDPIMFSIFGDFNFRLDLSTLINDFSDKGNLVEFKDNNQKLLKVVFKASDDKEVFTIEEKKFKWNHNSSIQCVKTELMKYDIELSMFEEPLYEAERNFPPSYPFMEEIESPDEYMESRCPSWCDRIIMNKNFMKFVEKESESTEYGMIGEGVCMGDHKPIYLFFKLHEQKSQTSVRHDNELSNNNIVNNINTLTYPLNYVYLNNKLISFHDSSYDLHDNALFINISLLKFNSQFSKFAQYSIENLSPNRQNKIKDNLICLNTWLKSILDLILNSKSCEKCLLNKLNENNCLMLNGLRVDKSFFTTFFLNSLNGNFFKLNHLYAFINNTIQILSNRLESNVDINNNLENNLENINLPLDFSSKSLFFLNEIYKFLTLPCTYNYLKLALNKNNNFKKYLLFNQNNTFINNKLKINNINNINLKKDSRINKFGERLNKSVNNNNNNENFVNLNEIK